MLYFTSVADPDLDLVLLAFFPSVISSFLPKIKGGEGSPGSASAHPTFEAKINHFLPVNVRMDRYTKGLLK